MKKKNLFVSCAALSLLLASLIACNGNNSSKAPESKADSTPASEPVSVPASEPVSEPVSEPASTPASEPVSTPASENPGPAAALKTWSADEVKAGLSNASAKEVKDETGDVQFTAYKLGTANDTVTFKWTPTADQAGKVAFNLIFTTKSGNATNATFWYQSSSSTNAKMEISVDGTALPTPSDNPNFQDLAGADGVVDSDVADSGTLANPISYKMAEFDVTAGAENTIVVKYLGGGYSFYIAGAAVYKA